MKSQALEIRYEPSFLEGQCTLKSITPIAFSSAKFAIFSLFSIFLIGLPFVFVQWFPQLKLWAYYIQCKVQEATHFSILNSDDEITIVKKQEMQYNCSEKKIKDFQEMQKKKQCRKTVFFLNRYMKYIVDKQQNCFRVKPNSFSYQNYIRKILTDFLAKKRLQGYSPDQVEELRENFGPGCMIVENPSITTLFFREIIKPLYIFLVFTAVVWSLEEYYYYFLIILVTTLAGLIANLYQSYSINKKIYQMAYHEVDLNVLRSNSVIEISSQQIVPGDIVFLKQNTKIPFDGLILEGSALMNQCALTGQSAPIVRKAQDFNNLLKNLSQSQSFQIQIKNNIVCEGTSLIQVDNKKKMQLFQEYRERYGIPVCVIRTNFITLKGQLIRIISFPIQKRNIFQKQSVKFLFFMFVLSFFSSVMLFFRLKDYIRLYILVLKFCDLITVAVPPGLPVSMTFGAIHAVEKLRKKDIFCISPNKIINGGFVDLICFDKTGTLTEDFMDLKCIVPSVKGKFKQPIQNSGVSEVKLKANISKIIKEEPNVEQIFANIATNHSIVKIERTNQNVGDPMQVKLFQFGEYQFSEAQKTSQLLQQREKWIFGFESKRGHYGVLIRRQQFDSQLLRTSSIARSSLKQGFGELFLYTKGSPQVIKRICNPSSLPQNYDQVLKDYAASGFRVLGIAHRHLENQKLSSKRVQIEQDMTFDGFLIFENKLKGESRAAMMELLQAQIPCVMITGDHALTACNLSYKCGISSLKKKLYIVDYNKQSHLFEIEEFFYKSGDGSNLQIENNEQQQDECQNYQIQQNQQLRLKKKANIRQGDELQENQYSLEGIQQISQLINNQKTQICLTGNAFQAIFFENNLQANQENVKKILKHTRVYARATPNDKTRIVIAYQYYLGKVVAMCGDGANDCGALKQSDAGLSISQTQASISAPFTSKIPNITAMVELIKQCRAGLVTNFSLFNIMALYALIQSTSTVIIQYYFCFPSNLGLFYWDVCGNFLFFMVFGFTETSKKLTSEKTSCSLFTLTNILQILVMHLIQMGGQILMIISVSSFFQDETDYNQNGGTMTNFQKYKNNGQDFSTVCIENSACFLFSNLMYIFSFAALSISKPWKQSIFTNIPFLVLFIIFTAYSLLLIVVPSVRLKAFYIVGFDHNLVNFYTLLLTLVFAFVIYINQKVIMETVAIKLRKMYPNKKWL